MTINVTAYMRRLLEPDENVVCKGGLHWVYLISGILWLGILAGMGWAADYALWHYFGQYVPRYGFENSMIDFKLERNAIGILFTACGAVLFLTQWLRYLATGLLVTTRRVIYKTGLINVKIDGTDISDIRGVHVDQGWIGQFLNYGKIRLDNRFIADVHLPYIAAPYKVTRLIQKVKSDLEGHIEDTHDAKSVMTSVNPHPVMHQTIIQIGETDKGHIIHQPDDKTIVIEPIGRAVQPKAIEQQTTLHDDILDDFNKRKV